MTIDVKSLETTKEDVKELKGCYKFGPRISHLEGRAKSDLIAVTNRLNEILTENKKNLKRSDAMKLIYAMNVDVGKSLTDPTKHRSMYEPTYDNPKLKTEIQARLNLIDWQL